MALNTYFIQIKSIYSQKRSILIKPNFNIDYELIGFLLFIRLFYPMYRMKRILLFLAFFISQADIIHSACDAVLWGSFF